MAWFLKPEIPDTESFAGQMVYNTEDIEIQDTAISEIESVGYKILGRHIVKQTGFESHTYNYKGLIEVLYIINWSSNMTFALKNQLHRLSIALNGTGAGLKIQDTFIAGTESTPIIYTCRWKNAGDFVDNSEILAGGKMKLLSYLESTQVTILEYQKVIDIPPSTLQWQFKINDVDADEVYERIP